MVISTTIFKNLPEMMIQQVLEFAGVAGGDGKLYRLSYNPKKKAIVITINPEFMRDTLMYKINNPCKAILFRNPSGTVIRANYTYVPPPKIQAYTVMTDNVYDTYHIEIHRKYQRMIAVWNKRINRKKEMDYINSVSIRNIYPNSTFRESILKMCVRKIVY